MAVGKAQIQCQDFICFVLYNIYSLLRISVGLPYMQKCKDSAIPVSLALLIFRSPCSADLDTGLDPGQSAIHAIVYAKVMDSDQYNDLGRNVPSKPGPQSRLHLILQMQPWIFFGLAMSP